MSKETRPITIAIAALGGQGGGVLTNWIVDIAEHAQYVAQSTSVPGVAQRTGATIYCVEIFPKAAAEKAGRDPVFALMPVPGDVDIVIAAELLEAGRAIQRGFVTSDTILIASSHRMYAMVEKTAMADGIIDGSKVTEAAENAAKRFICFDMNAAAEATGSVISSILLGALAGSGALPLPREAFEEAIRRSGIAVETNLAGFARGFDEAFSGGASERASQETLPSIMPGDAKSSAANNLLTRIVSTFPAPSHPLIIEGVKRLVDYQGMRYAGLYLDRLEHVLELDQTHGGDDKGYALTVAAARYLALWMSYEDIIRVADLKTRSSRFERFRNEVRAASDQLVYVTEFMHPRVEEICDTLPAPVGRYFLGSERWRRFLGLFCRKGRRVNTTKISGFLLLHSLAALKRWRRITLRFKKEDARIEQWLSRISETAPQSYTLAVEIAECQRLIKGYSDTHERGVANFERIMSALDKLPANEETARKAKELREAALADDEGFTLTEALKKVA